MNIIAKRNTQVLQALNRLNLVSAHWDHINKLYDVKTSLGFVGETEEEKAYWKEDSKDFKEFLEKVYKI
jgi:hypothetical protein